MSSMDIIVIGAGSVGANVAYRLAERGASVTVFEAGAPGGGTSGTSFAWTNSFHKTPRDYHDLNTASAVQHLSPRERAQGRRWLQAGALAWEENLFPGWLRTVEQLGSGWGASPRGVI
jgi:glycine/D-amino acid oxidase-like deaminating enzyme